MYIPYLNASKFQIILNSKKGHPFPYWTQVIAGSLQPFVSTGVNPLGTRHWKKYPSCILLLPYNSASVNYVPIRNHMKKDLQKKISLPNGGRTAVLHDDSSWSARMIIKTKWENMSVLNQTSIQNYWLTFTSEILPFVDETLLRMGLS